MKKAATEAAGTSDDFRVRAAREKRERMRSRLLSAIMEVYLPGERHGLAVIDDVVRKAEVARGTFYKYFDSLDAALAELGREMADEMLRAFAELFAEDESPAIKVAAGPLITLARAAMEPRWGAFVSRVDYVEHFSQRNVLGSVVTKSLLRARETGVLSFTHVEAATDLIVGATVEGTRRMIHGEQQTQAYSEELTMMSLMALGMTREAAATTVAVAWKRIVSNAAMLSWWRELK